MFTPQTLGVALAMMITSAICWGSWANTYKGVKNYRFELFYWDYAVGIFLISLVLANHAMSDQLRLSERAHVWQMIVLTGFLSFLMVSTIKFRSFKDLRLNARTFALVAFAVGSSAIVSSQTRPALVLVWLLSCYVVIALVESFLAIARRTRRAEARAEARRSIPPTG